MDNKQKNTKLNRIIYVSLAVLLVAIVTLAAISGALNRTRKKPPETAGPSETTVSPVTTAAPVTRPTPDTTQKAPGTADTTAIPDTTGAIVPGDGNFEDVDLPTPTLPSFSVPVKGRIAKPHDNMTAVYSATMNDWRVHLGVDISTSIGADVRSSADGTVSQVWDDPLMGKCVSISHTGSGLSIYKNLAPELPASVTVGARVSEGDIIGAVGESAIIEIADEPHLHFELTVGGVHVDPLDYFDPESVSTSLSSDIYE